ncbi:adenylosuccinate lyase [Candidatus Bathyarchaeota archaeon]|nr:adenylosuccinate lyase [Candidatus Bathyarchaeota archaeon]MBS7612742.1 adenylosuccinate lyase [Candidatus Bathyarchaeota archaeon]MBS7617714.1 adenylosuccinate lyase [Candidatus Bathyarchaeota archaeon]
MPVHPIEYRYGTAEMRKIWDRDEWLKRMIMVEAALLKALSEVGSAPVEAADKIYSLIESGAVTLKDVNRWERVTDHEVMAVVKALAEKSDVYGGYIHVGATSNDITDTVLATQLRDSIDLIESRLKEIAFTLIDLSEKYKDLVCLGRTHGVAALPTTMGFKFAAYASEIIRHIERLEEAKPRICVGKMSGAVGTMASFGDEGFKIQKRVMEIMGVYEPIIATQVVPRDGLAEFATLAAIISSTLDKVANEIRNLQRSEIRELEEPFREDSQVGSSTMPHKRNPIKCEKICGLARIVRSMALAALENIVLEHERDLTNSSCERVMLPEVCLLLDEQLKTMIDVLKGLKVYPDNVRRNLESQKDLIMSEAVMIAMVSKGADRQWSHEIIRKCSMEAWKAGKRLRDVLVESLDVRRYLTVEEIEKAMMPENYIGTAREQVEKVTAYIKGKLKT